MVSVSSIIYLDLSLQEAKTILLIIKAVKEVIVRFL